MSIFAVAGKPVLHSLSPSMHNAAFKAASLPHIYTRLRAESARQAKRMALEIGIKGLNVTSPFKEEMVKNVDKLDEEAKVIGAINTVVFEDDVTKGFNTDGEGVLGALKNARNDEIAGKKALVIGAGGAAKAAVLALGKENANVMVTNRTVEKAREIAEKFGCEYCRVDDVESIRNADFIVSGVNTSERVIPRDALREGMTVLDANYSTATALAIDAVEKGCLLVDGKQWLLHQGIKAFELFTRQKPDVHAMSSALYAEAEQGKGKGVALIGLSGSGKTTVAKIIARQTCFKLTDIDCEIEKSSGASIADIFKTKGEGFFRDLETKEIMKTSRQKVVACGGGAVLRSENREHLKKNFVVLWLYVKPEVAAARLKDDELRPLLSSENRESRNEKIKKMALDRKEAYARTADIIIEAEQKPEEVAGVVLDEMRFQVNH